MRILLLSDIHANIVALETVLQVAPGYDAVWCLGDVVGYGPAPNECVARVRGLDALTLTGNHDQAVVDQVPLREFNETAQAALRWTQRVTTQENKRWLAARVPRLTLPEHDLTLVHASPRDPIWEYIANAQVAAENFPFFTTSFCFFGHTHRPIAYRLRVAERILSAQVLPTNQLYGLEPKLLLNPGSVGQPRDGDPRAAYAIYDTEGQQLTLYRAVYDIAATQQAMRDAALPKRLIERLAVGD